MFRALLCCPAMSSERATNVLLIAIDTQRADRLGCYGYARLTSPHLDRFAAQGVRFEEAYSAPTSPPIRLHHPVHRARTSSPTRSSPRGARSSTRPPCASSGPPGRAGLLHRGRWTTSGAGSSPPSSATSRTCVGPGRAPPGARPRRSTPSLCPPGPKRHQDAAALLPLLPLLGPPHPLPAPGAPSTASSTRATRATRPTAAWTAVFALGLVRQLLPEVDAGVTDIRYVTAQYDAERGLRRRLPGPRLPPPGPSWDLGGHPGRVSAPTTGRSWTSTAAGSTTTGCTRRTCASPCCCASRAAPRPGARGFAAGQRPGRGPHRARRPGPPRAGARCAMSGRDLALCSPAQRAPRRPWTGST